MKKLIFIGVALLSLVAQSAMADFLGLANGRSANMDNMADMSVEGGATLGSNAKLFGTRLNYKATPDLMVFGDIGMFDTDGAGDGLVYGFGAFYQLRGVTLMENTDLAIKGAYHLGSLEEGDGFDVDYSEITIKALFSGDQLGDTDFGWYANAGIHIIKAELPGIDFGFGLGTVGGGSADSNELGFGGGITGPLSFGEFYAGVDFIDGALLVGGIRYNL